MKTYYVYKTTNTKTGDFYIGRSKQKGNYYLGSGNLIKTQVEKYGRANFTKQILFETDSYQEAKNKEEELISENINNKKCLNLIIKSSHTHLTDYDKQKRIKDYNKLKNVKKCAKKWNVSSRTAYYFIDKYIKDDFDEFFETKKTKYQSCPPDFVKIKDFIEVKKETGWTSALCKLWSCTPAVVSRFRKRALKNLDEYSKLLTQDEINILRETL